MWFWGGTYYSEDDIGNDGVEDAVDDDGEDGVDDDDVGSGVAVGGDKDGDG